MKIALLTDGIYPYVMGGMQKHSYYLAKYLARHKIYVDLYHTTLGVETGTYDLFESNEKEYISFYLIDFPRNNKYPGHYIVESYKYSANIYTILKERLNVDFIYCQGFTGWKLLREKSNQISGSNKFPPVGVNFHGMEMFQTAPTFGAKLKYTLLGKPTLYNLLNADFAFSLGGKLTGILKKIGVKENRIIQTPIGIGDEWISDQIASDNTAFCKTFVFIGRYERRKGIEELSEVLLKLLKEHNFVFHFVGPVPENKKLSNNNVKYWGSVALQEDIKKILTTCDILVCPSYCEGMPNVILEAMASGLSVIATDVGAVNCLVNSENGWLIQPGNELQLLHAMVEAIAIDPVSLAEKKRKSKEIIKANYLWGKVALQTIQEIQGRISVNSK